MAIETIEDVVEEIMNGLGIYGAHEDERCDRRVCRCCATSSLTTRLRAAFNVEKKLAAPQEERT
jgi:hypothetical protein